ncbi:MAG: hypothetical protein ACOY3J_04730 [Bacillota bacterium]|uniref:Uncharacterized protein n=1 Tax=Thermanaerosceptrum fracticalcis TaxID=1712410 RepID=A0A7G6E6I1_THEFR|nr:hypothetical protein [Thermanaerosceptrum fracticalcis]QNB47685.1 hypothetical protein BR63_16260 [Thermanaerosceptrum fracticalcis]
MAESRVYDLGNGVTYTTRRNEQRMTGAMDIEDMREQGITNEVTGEKARNKAREQHKRFENNKFEMGQDFGLGRNPHRAFEAVRDIDADGMGKKKTGFDFNFFGDE